MRPGDAVMELTRLGFHFRLEGEAVKVRFEGKRTPDPAMVSQLIKLVRQHKVEVVYFLKCHCSQCGGVVFVGNQCFICDWLPKARGQTSGLEGEPAQTCGVCAHFLPSRLNPSQGFGKCGLAQLSKRPGAYPGKTACSHYEGVMGDDTLRLVQ